MSSSIVPGSDPLKRGKKRGSSSTTDGEISGDECPSGRKRFFSTNEFAVIITLPLERPDNIDPDFTDSLNISAPQLYDVLPSLGQERGSLRSNPLLDESKKKSDAQILPKPLSREGEPRKVDHGSIPSLEASSDPLTPIRRDSSRFLFAAKIIPAL